MAVSNTGPESVAYGLNNALQSLAPQPIIARRDPTGNDSGSFGQLWVNRSTNAYFVFTSITAGVANWQAQATGSGTFADVSVTGNSGTVLEVAAGGDTLLGGDLDITGNTVMTGGLIVNGDLVANGDFDITSAEAISFTSTADMAAAIALTADGGSSETVAIGSLQGTGLDSVHLYSDSGGIKIEAENSTNNKAVNIIASTGGYQLDAVKQSAINVVGAGEDLQLNATGGSVKVTSTESTAAAVALTASGVAGTVVITGAGGATLAGTNNTVAITSGTGALNISADAVATAVNIATGAAAKTVVIGNNTTTTSVSVQAGTAAGGSILVGTTANDVPVTIGSSTGASAIVIAGGTSGVLVGTNAIAHPVTLGNNTGATVVAINAGTAGAGAINIATTANDVPTTIGNSTGASGVVIAAGTAGVSVGANAVAHTVTIGNNTGATAVAINAGTAAAGSIHIGTTANAVPIVIGNVTGATGVTINSGTGGVALTSTGAGDITIASSDTCLIDCAGVLELNSSAGQINIGNDAVGAQINIGTGASDRDITIGNVTASTTVTINTPTGTLVSIPKGINIGVSVLSGTGDPNASVTAAQGSLYLRTDGSSTSTRAYINSDSGTTWIAITTAS